MTVTHDANIYFVEPHNNRYPRSKMCTNKHATLGFGESRMMCCVCFGFCCCFAVSDKMYLYAGLVLCFRNGFITFNRTFRTHYITNGSLIKNTTVSTIVIRSFPSSSIGDDKSAGTNKKNNTNTHKGTLLLLLFLLSADVVVVYLFPNYIREFASYTTMRLNNIDKYVNRASELR